MKKRKLAGNNTAGQYGNLQKHLVVSHDDQLGSQCTAATPLL